MQSSNIDVFSGGADGLCAVHQLRMTYPVHAQPITGVRRDAGILDRVQAHYGDNVTVFDISMSGNRDALRHMLRLGANIKVFDHHYLGPEAHQPGLTAMLSGDEATCTSALVDRYLGGQHRVWAVVGAFGEHRDELAHQLARPLHLSSARMDRLRELGQCLSYNAYGESAADCIVDTTRLYGRLSRYSDPLKFMAQEAVYEKLRAGREQDMAVLQSFEPAAASKRAAVVMLPDEPYSRRGRGELAARLAAQHSERAHAVLAPNGRGGHAVSVRAPSVSNRWDAAAFCRRFGGNGTSTAAGISDLPASAVNVLKGAFIVEFPS